MIAVQQIMADTPKEFSEESIKTITRKEHQFAAHPKIETSDQRYDLCSKYLQLSYSEERSPQKTTGGMTQHKEFSEESINMTTRKENEFDAHPKIERNDQRYDLCNKYLQVSYSERVSPQETMGETRTPHLLFKFICKFCNKSFGTKGNLSVHIRIHTLEKPYICQICTKSFNTKGNLNTHLLTHNPLKPFLCEICTKGFTTKGNLQVHMRSHTKDRPFPCVDCSKCFSTKANLLTHAIIHTSEKPFSCDFCSKQFTAYGNLIAHRRIHDQERQFPCHHCGKIYYTNGNLNNHMITKHSAPIISILSEPR